MTNATIISSLPLSLTPRSWALLGVTLFVSTLLILRTLPKKRQHGLPQWPVVGMLPSLLMGLRGNYYEWMSRGLNLCDGTFWFEGGALTSLTCLVTADPHNVEHMLKTRFASFPKGEKVRGSMRDLLGDGIFNADDETWRRQRRVASVEFHSARFRQLTAESVVELVHRRLLPVLQDSIDKSTSIDLQDVLLRLTFDNVCMIAFGADPGCLRVGLPDIPFARAFEDATETTMSRFVTPAFVWRAMRWLDIGPERALKDSIKCVDEFAHKVIRTRKQELSSPDEDGRGRSDLLTVFMRMRDDEGNKFDDKFLRDICVNFILAGRDTSSVALSWFFWVLEGHPAVEERILEEMVEVLGGREGGDDEVPVFTVEEVKKMEYLHAAITESLRLYPSVPLDTKEAVEDEVFPDGTVLKKGTTVIYAMGRVESVWGKDCREFKPERWLRDGRFMSESAYKFTAFNGGPRLCLGKDFAYHQMNFDPLIIIVVEDEVFPDGTILKQGTKVIYAIYAMGRMEAIWGKDCREFKPERWLREGRFMSESAYKFTAFNGGPRLCLGKDFAYYQMKFVAASIIYRYRVKVVRGHPVSPKLALTMYMRHGLQVHLVKRDPSELEKYFNSE